jgi:hypothetical protein
MSIDDELTPLEREQSNFYRVVREGDPAAIKAQIGKLAGMNAKPDEERMLQVLESSMIRGVEPEIFKKAAAALMQEGMDINGNMPQTFGMGLLHRAAGEYMDGMNKYVPALLELGANPNKPDFDGNTPVKEAAYRGKTEALHALLEKGGDANLANKAGNTPLHSALQWADSAYRNDGMKMIKDLLRHGAEVPETRSLEPAFKQAQKEIAREDRQAAKAQEQGGGAWAGLKGRVQELLHRHHHEDTAPGGDKDSVPDNRRKADKGRDAPGR